jgi:hypothetical protein
LLVFADEVDVVEKAVVLVEQKGKEGVVGILRVFLRLALAKFIIKEDDIL